MSLIILKVTFLVLTQTQSDIRWSVCFSMEKSFNVRSDLFLLTWSSTHVAKWPNSFPKWWRTLENNIIHNNEQYCFIITYSMDFSHFFWYPDVAGVFFAFQFVVGVSRYLLSLSHTQCWMMWSVHYKGLWKELLWWSVVVSSNRDRAWRQQPSGGKQHDWFPPDMLKFEYIMQIHLDSLIIQNLVFCFSVCSLVKFT